MSKPKKVLSSIKLSAVLIAVLLPLHEAGKLVSVEDLATTTGTGAKAVLANLAKLQALGLAEPQDETKAKWKVAGMRCKVATQLVELLRLNGAPMTASEIGAALWADPKKAAKDPKAAVRYIAPAGAVLKTAFNIGLVYRMEADGAPPTFGVVA